MKKSDPSFCSKSLKSSFVTSLPDEFNSSIDQISRITLLPRQGHEHDMSRYGTVYLSLSLSLLDSLYQRIKFSSCVQMISLQDMT